MALRWCLRYEFGGFEDVIEAESIGGDELGIGATREELLWW